MISRDSNNQLLLISMEFFIYCASIESILRKKISQEEIKSKLELIKNKTISNGVPLGVIDDLIYGLCVYIDEKILKLNNETSEQWKKNPLQLQYYQENIAGESFFEKLTSFRQNLPQKIDLLEVYYYCIELGFIGIYNILGDKALKILKSDIYEQINAIRGGEKKLESNSVQGELVLFENKKKLKIMILSCFILMFIVYVFLSLSIDIQGDNYLSVLQTI